VPLRPATLEKAAMTDVPPAASKLTTFVFFLLLAIVLAFVAYELVAW
jgi:hypothetical protein